MIKFFKNYKRNQGMTYVELIVVLSIFASLSTVVMFNYNEFQERIDIKNLSSDIALKVVEAQKSSISGRLPPSQPVGGQNWKPSYGVYLDHTPNNKIFYYFTDLDPNVEFDDYDCSGSGECLEIIEIKKVIGLGHSRLKPKAMTIKPQSLARAMPPMRLDFFVNSARTAGSSLNVVMMSSLKMCD